MRHQLIRVYTYISRLYPHTFYNSDKPRDMAERQLQFKDGDLAAQIASNEDIKVAGLKREDSSRPHPGDPNENLEGDTPISFNRMGDIEANQSPAQTDAASSAKPTDWLHNLWTSRKLPDRSSDAHAVARAEAASWAQMTPLIAATFGPLAILLGIPSLTQKLHAQIIVDPSDGSSTLVELPYPTLNLVISGVVMLCEILGNLFLVLRFSNFHTKLMTWLSYIFWLSKSVIGIANYIQFGLAHPETEDIVYLQGFWVPPIFISNCRLVSVV